MWRRSEPKPVSLFSVPLRFVATLNGCDRCGCCSCAALGGFLGTGFGAAAAGTSVVASTGWGGAASTTGGLSASASTAAGICAVACARESLAIGAAARALVGAGFGGPGFDGSAAFCCVRACTDGDAEALAVAAIAAPAVTFDALPA